MTIRHPGATLRHMGVTVVVDSEVSDEYDIGDRWSVDGGGVLTVVDLNGYQVASYPSGGWKTVAKKQN